jgi:hypothetical protein
MKIFKAVIITCTLSIISIHSFASRQCPPLHPIVGVSYTWKWAPEDKRADQQIGAIEYWSTDSDKLIVFPNRNIVERWNKTGHSINFTRYFLSEKRAIEYTQGDLLAIGKYQAWDQIINFGLPKFKSLMTSASNSSSSAHCMNTHIVNSTDGDSRLKMELFHSNGSDLENWVKRVEGIRHHHFYLLTAKAYYTKPKLDDLINTLDDFNKLDFADIGDNESDPFIANMIKMGFLEHAEGSAH